MKVKTKERQDEIYSWGKKKSVRKLEIDEMLEKYLDYELKDLIKLLNKEAKKYNLEEKNKEKKEFNDFSNKFKKHNLSYKEFKELKDLERIISYNFLQKIEQ